VLPRPFGGQAGEARKPHAMGESALDGRLDEIRREARFAMLSGVAVAPAISSSSQRRPRAALISERIANGQADFIVRAEKDPREPSSDLANAIQNLLGHMVAVRSKLR
jgi:hypothetical protein